MIAMTSAPRLYCESSLASGRFTLMMMSASFNASALTVAPTAVNSESGRPDLMPAPGSIATSAPNALNFFTVSGEAATRGSDGSISLATAIFMGPPGAAGARASKLASFSLSWIPVSQPACVQILATAGVGGAGSDASGQEITHQCDDNHHGGRAVFDQHDEPFIGLLMGRIVVAVSGRVGHFVMVCHRYPQSKSAFLACNYRKAFERATAPGLSGHSEGQLSRIQRVRLSSLTSPAARERMMAVACAASGAKGMSLLRRKTIMAWNAIRLLPSTKAWLRARPNA